MAFDVDSAQAIATRRRIFDMAASDRLRVADMRAGVSAGLENSSRRQFTGP